MSDIAKVREDFSRRHALPRPPQDPWERLFVRSKLPTFTFGELAWIVGQIGDLSDVSHPKHGSWLELENMLTHAHGYADFKRMVGTHPEIGDYITPSSVKKVRFLVARKIGFEPDKVDRLILTDVVAILKSEDTLSDPRPPVMCSQASLARFETRSAHTTGLLEILKAEGILSHFIKNGRKHQVWFKDDARHARALTELSGKPGKRPARRRKT